jgi:hypothetical protein
VLLRGGK